MTIRLEDPWLVAAWPGMGGVALMAGTHLARQLRARRLTQIPAGAYFEPQGIDVHYGLARAEALPESTLYACKTPPGARDLLLFLGEAQPSAHGQQLCEDLLREASAHDVERVVTFAALGTRCHPRADPRVFAAANGRDFLSEVTPLGVETLEEGRISGLNGLLLAVAARRNLPALCLLGEFPYFASGLPNPKASMALLREFAPLVGVELDVTRLEEEAGAVEENLVEILEQLEAEEDHDEDDWDDEQERSLPGELAGLQGGGAPLPRSRVGPEVLAQIEDLFVAARKDREKGLELKALLDRHGLFGAYEDRFLDLFKRAE